MRGNRCVTLADLRQEIVTRPPGDLLDLRLAAVHEAGHALATALGRPGSLGHVSIRTTESDGATVARSIGEPVRLESVEILLRALLAGRAAEYVAFGRISAGSGGGTETCWTGYRTR